MDAPRDASGLVKQLRDPKVYRSPARAIPSGRGKVCWRAPHICVGDYSPMTRGPLYAGGACRASRASRWRPAAGRVRISAPRWRRRASGIVAKRPRLPAVPTGGWG